MKKNKKIILLSVDMGSQVINKNLKYLKEQYINVGVSESNAISVAAGMASRGFIVYVYGISTFIFNRPRAQIRHDVIIGNNHINIIGSGVGLTYSQDGPSHHPVEDYTGLCSLPNSKLIIPFDEKSAELAVKETLNKKFSTFIKLDKGNTENKYLKYKNGFYYKIKNKKKWVITTGMEASSILNDKSYSDYSVGVLFASYKNNLNFIKKFIPKNSEIIVSDESFAIGGLYSYITTLLSLAKSYNVVNKCLNNKFIQKKYNRLSLRKKYAVI